jgi:hypothetical protein
MQAIRRMYPSAPMYLNYTRSNWNIEANIEMSYSYFAAGIGEDDCYEF